MSESVTILVVDDVAANRETLRELLVVEDYQLVEAASGPAALQLAAETTPDLVLLDIMMPGMDGFEVCRRLRADTRLAEVPVIMVTALDDHASRVTAIEAGADDFVTKPYDRVELRARVRTTTRLNRYRRLAEARVALDASENRFRSLFELGPVAIYSCDAAGMIEAFNRCAAKLWGREPKLGDPTDRFCGSLKLYLPDGTLVPHAQCPMVDVLSGKISAAKDLEVVIERPDGSRITVLASIVPLKNDRGEITGAINCFHDITERKTSEIALRESDQWLRAVFDQAAVGVVQNDVATGRFQRVNQRFCDLVGYPSDELLRLSFTDITHRQDLELNLENVSRLREGSNREFLQEKRYVRKDGSLVWASIAVSSIGAPGKRPDSFIAVVQDITERKLAEDQMLRTQRLENLGMLAAGIAHDFNNALAPIIMAGPLLRESLKSGGQPRRNGDSADADFHALRKAEVNPGAQRLLNIVERCAERGAGLVRQLLSFARGASGERQLLQARHVLRELGDLVEVTFPKAIRIRIVLPGELWPIQANATQIHQVFLNLCVNARDAMLEGGDLTLTAANRTLDAAAAAGIAGARPGDFFTVEVKDSGEGIPPNVLTRIWEPFYTTKGAGKGTGLGLSTVRGIVQQHDGFVTVQTREGHGTTFTIYLPAASGGRDGEAGPDHAHPARGRDELILIVDDDENVRAIAEQILSGHGYRTLTACDGADAIATFAPRATEVRLLLTDLQMPLLGGPALAKALRRLRPDLPIIAMSGAASRGSNATHKEFTTAYLAKPFQAETLLSIVRETLDSATPAAP